jgi:hypothetical protein
MKRHVKIPALLFLGLLIGCPAAMADPIRISGGTFQMTGPTGTVSLIGSRGFTLSAHVSVFDGAFAPWEDCHFAPKCVPGAVIQLAGQFAGTGVPGTATLDGRPFPNLGLLEADDHALLRFVGSVFAPVFDGETATLVAPFTFNGSFATANSFDLLTGAGTSTLVLRQGFGAKEGLPLAWDFVSARYDFEPVPEPATLVLTAAGLLALVSRRRRPHRHAR